MSKENIKSLAPLETGVKSMSDIAGKTVSANVEVEAKQMQKIENIKNKVSDLLSKNENLKIWFDKVSSSGVKTISDANTYEIFLKVKIEGMSDDEIKNLSEEKLNQMYVEWNKERLAQLRKGLTLNNIEAFSINYQKNFILNGNGVKKEKFIKNSSAVLNDKNTLEGVIDLFYGYSLNEIVGELILSEDFKTPEGLKKIQNLASLSVKDNRSFEIKVDGLWGRQTFNFFKSLLKDANFVDSANGNDYVKKIKEVLSQHKEYAEDLSLYRSMSDVAASMEQYAKNPIKYWKDKGVSSKHFVSIEASKTPYSSVDTMSQIDGEFIKENRNTALDGNLSDLFDARGKSPEQAREIRDRLKSMFPKDELKIHLENFLKNKKVREEFSKLFKLPQKTLDDPNLVNILINDGGGHDEFKNIRNWITSGMWASVGSDLVSLSIDLQSYIRKQCGLSALSVRSKFLQSVFGEDTTFESVERDVKILPSEDRYPIYFRDKNNPSMVYEYRPNTGDIFVEKYYSTTGDVLNFGKGGKITETMPIHTMKKKFSDFMQNISVLSLLPKNRCDSRKDIKDYISKNIEDRMNYSVEDNVGATMRSNNDLMRLKNGTIDLTLQMFGFIDPQKVKNGTETGVSLNKESSGPYYHLMSRLINSVDGASKEDLQVLNTFLADLGDKLRHSDSVDLNSINNPLIKFIVAERRGLNAYGEDKVKVDSKEDEWKKKDLLLGIMMDSLFVNGKIDFNKVKVLQTGISDVKFVEMASNIERTYNEKAKQYEIAVVSRMTSKNLQALQHDVFIGNEYGERFEDAYS